MGIKISIIIPAYNAEKYIERCIHSLSVQDIPVQDYEAIVINDGSTDNTERLLSALCKQYPFLRYILTPNSGLSASRNRGTSEATGEYLLFLDADDTICTNCIKSIYEEASTNHLDMMLMNYRHILSDGSLAKTSYHIDRNDEAVEAGKDFLIRKSFPPMIPLYAYRRTFIKDSSLSFLSIGHEDEEFTPKAIYQAQRIKYYPLTFYNYFQNSESFMNSYKESNFYDMITAMHSLNQFKLAHQEDNNIVAYFDNHIANRLLMIFKRSIRDGYTIQDRLIEEMKRGGLYPLKPKNPSFYTILFNYSPRLFEKYYRFIKHKPR